MTIHINDSNPMPLKPVIANCDRCGELSPFFFVSEHYAAIYLGDNGWQVIRRGETNWACLCPACRKLGKKLE